MFRPPLRVPRVAPVPLAAAVLLAFARAPALAAQVPDTIPAQAPDTVVIVDVTEGGLETGVELPELDEPTTPGGAFLRALLVPGWGHASIGAYRRAGAYFAAEATTGLLLARTLRRLSLAREARDLEELRLRMVLEARGTPADSVPVLLEQDVAVGDARGLVVSREQQVEDWIAFGAFLLFLSGADAFVSAHLRDFPAPLEPEAALRPEPGGGFSASFGIRVKVGP